MLWYMYRNVDRWWNWPNLWKPDDWVGSGAVRYSHCTSYFSQLRQHMKDKVRKIATNSRTHSRHLRIWIPIHSQPAYKTERWKFKQRIELICYSLTNLIGNMPTSESSEDSKQWFSSGLEFMYEKNCIKLVIKGP